MHKQHIDLDRVKREAKLFEICDGDTHLTRKAATCGGEWTGSCPFCGGEDRFNVQPYAAPPRWMCHHCTGGKWKTVIDYLARREHLDPHTREGLEKVCSLAAGGVLPTSEPTRVEPRAPSSYTPASEPPPDEWQQAARNVIQECQDDLWAPGQEAVLDYLRYDRNLDDLTIQNFHLGYCAPSSKEKFGRNISGLWVPSGIVIPCIDQGFIWYIKIRYTLTVRGDSFRQRNRKKEVPLTLPA